MKIKILFLLISPLVLIAPCRGQNIRVKVSWYSAWINQVDQLATVPNNDIVPIGIGESNYRVLKVTNNGGHSITITGASVVSNFIKVKVYGLPIIKNYSGVSILDVMIPLFNNPVVIDKGNSAYFLIRFNGLQKGDEVVSIVFFGNDSKLFKVTKQVKVGDVVARDLTLNVWAYFNYPLLKNIKQKVISDLQNHGANVLVIPPSGMSSTFSEIQDESKLKNYLQGTSGRFDYYLLFLNYNSQNESSFLFSSLWEKRFLHWIDTVKKIFGEEGIGLSKVLLYPYDEPTPEEARKFIRMQKFCQGHNVPFSFYTTIGDPNSAFVAQYAKIVQSYFKANVISAVKKYLKPKSELWLYEISALSRNISPAKYLQNSWLAFAEDADGIGVWNYGDVEKLYAAPIMKRIINPRNTIGSWQLPVVNKVKDYSLVYRRGDNLYSSLRWEALSFAKDDISFLKLYQKKFGIVKAKELSMDLINGKRTLSEWEKIKLSLLE